MCQVATPSSMFVIGQLMRSLCPPLDNWQPTVYLGAPFTFDGQTYRAVRGVSIHPFPPVRHDVFGVLARTGDWLFEEGQIVLPEGWRAVAEKKIDGEVVTITLRFEQDAAPDCVATGGTKG